MEVFNSYAFHWTTHTLIHRLTHTHTDAGSLSTPCRCLTAVQGCRIQTTQISCRMWSLQYVGNWHKTTYHAFYLLKHLCLCLFHREYPKPVNVSDLQWSTENPRELHSSSYHKISTFFAFMCDFTSMFAFIRNVCMCETVHMRVWIYVQFHMDLCVPTLMCVYYNSSVFCQYQCQRPEAGCTWLAPGEDLGLWRCQGLQGQSLFQWEVPGTRWTSLPWSSLFRCSVRKMDVSAHGARGKVRGSAKLLLFILRAMCLYQLL